MHFKGCSERMGVSSKERGKNKCRVQVLLRGRKREALKDGLSDFAASS